MQLTQIVLVEDEGPADLRVLVAQLQAWYPALDIAMLAVPDTLAEAVEEADSCALIALGGIPVAILGFDRPLNADELAEPLRRSWWWPEAAEAVAPHRAHFLLSIPADRAPGPTAALEQLRLLSATAAALAASQPTSAILAAPGHVLHPAQTLLDARPHLFEPEPPLPLWLCIRAGHLPPESEGGPNLAQGQTLGLSDIVGVELDCAPLPAEPAQVFNLLVGVASLLASGTAIDPTDRLDGGPIGALSLGPAALTPPSPVRKRRLEPVAS